MSDSAQGDRIVILDEDFEIIPSHQTELLTDRSWQYDLALL